jgi:glycosyl hydrolase family 26
MSGARIFQLVTVAVGALALAMILAGPVSEAEAATRAVDAYQQGVYVGAADPSGVAAFASTTGTSLTVASDFLPGNAGWSGMDGANGSLSWQFAQEWTGTGYTLSLGVPIIPSNSAGTPVGTLATGATGAYDPYYVTLAHTLINADESNAYLRLGWEFDGSWFAWSATSPSSESNYATYFQRIVTAMRSVPGENFKFVWNPDATAFTEKGYNVTLAYPGSTYVDDIAIDAYDQTWVTPQTVENAWSETVLPALTAASSFAESKSKPIAIPEWGVTIRTDGHGLGDDSYYVYNMMNWMKNAANNVAYESYFNFNGLPNGGGTNAQITGGSFPNSLKVFIAYMN